MDRIATPRHRHRGGKRLFRAPRSKSAICVITIGIGIPILRIDGLSEDSAAGRSNISSGECNLKVLRIVKPVSDPVHDKTNARIRSIHHFSDNRKIIHFYHLPQWSIAD